MIRVPIRHMRRPYGAAIVTLVAGCLALSSVRAAETAFEADPDGSPMWQRVRQSLFQQRPIDTAATGIVVLDAPSRAEDAATVPIAIHTQPAPSRRVERIYLVIDRNPSPIAAVFNFFAGSGRADIETRVRVEEYTHMRAIAEMSDGTLVMATRWVKASGGCSAPAGKDAAAARATVGRMKVRVDQPLAIGQATQAQLMVSHPNSSGLAMDQVTHLYEPPYFVRKVTVSYAGRPVMTADVDFSISENPNFRFWFVPDAEGVLQVDVLDSKDLAFTERMVLRPRVASNP